VFSSIREKSARQVAASWWRSPIYPKFVEAMSAKAKTIRLGPPLERETKMGPLVSKDQFDRVRSYQELGKKEAKTCCRRRPPSVDETRLLRRTHNFLRCG
jgi:acyl-CoA reductase-like NAD-dependent aldehyde dehydrogenase